MTSWARVSGVLMLALLLSFGAATSVQVVAWGGMLAVRAIERGIAQAVASTFNGHDPCRLCRAADSLRQAEGGGPDQPATTPQFLKLLKVECPPVDPATCSIVSEQTVMIIPLSPCRDLVEMAVGPPEPPPPKLS